MLERRLRAAILELSRKGIGLRQIARTLEVSRTSVKAVIRSGTEVRPMSRRSSRLTSHREEILDLTERCKGNLVRVHEELANSGVAISYPALTAFVRTERPPAKKPAGRYEFGPGQEMQHDTSPHTVEIGGRRWAMQAASAALCYSHTLFFQYYHRFRRWEAKVFLTEALRYFEGAAAVTMIDNTSVIRSHGTGKDMVPAPEMTAFAERFGFVFKAHEVGDANRSARVERPFSYIEGNFLSGRTFTDVRDLNEKARQWCEKVNGTFKRQLRAVPKELYAVEKPLLRPLPIFIPEPERLEFRTVDVEGFVCVDTNRYSVPSDWLHRSVQVRVTAERVEIDEGGRTVVHQRVLLPVGQRVQLEEHRRPRGEKALVARQLDEERQLESALPGIASYAAALKKSGKRAPVLLLRRLLRMAREYPAAPLRAAIEEAERYGLFDLDRLERMVLERIAKDFFRFGGSE